MQTKPPLSRRIYDIRILVFMLFAAAGAAACDDSDPSVDGGVDAPVDVRTDTAKDVALDGPDSGVCPPGETLRYTKPGCGAEAKPVCGPVEQDACARPVCNCQGVTIVSCDYVPEPFSAFDACQQGDGGRDSASDGRDSATD